MTIRQHVVQKEYLESFVLDKNIGLYAFNVKNNKFINAFPRNICVEKKTYEIKGREPDNVIENYMSQNYEREAIKLIKKIVKQQNIDLNCFTEKDFKYIFKYLFLQLCRTDSGRIISHSVKMDLNNDFKNPRPHITEKEIKENQSIINDANILMHDHLEEFDKAIENVWNYFYPRINFGIFICKDSSLITTDNPVLTYSKPSENYPTITVIEMALSPNVLLHIEILRQGNSKRKKIGYFKDDITEEKVKMFNESVIFNANYWIVSGIPFSNELKESIKRHTDSNK